MPALQAKVTPERVGLAAVEGVGTCGSGRESTDLHLDAEGISGSQQLRSACI